MTLESILFKLNWMRKLTEAEQQEVRQALKEHKKTHAKWKVFPCVWECSNCSFWIDRYIPGAEPRPNEFIKYFAYCPGCGARMADTYGRFENYEE